MMEGYDAAKAQAFIVEKMKAVSYTHLDVYKRQAWPIVCAKRQYKKADDKICTFLIFYMKMLSKAKVILTVGPRIGAKPA